MADVLVVGAGLFGLTVAERLAEAGRKVTIVEKRPHIGGNAYSTVDEKTGIELHKYGAHIFHTSNEKVWDYVTRFTSFTDYRHTVKTRRLGEVLPMPINLATINHVAGRTMTPEQARQWVESQRVPASNPASLREHALSQIGPALFDAVIAGYTEKQWQTDARDLPASVVKRLPVRYSYNDDYFTDTHQGIPTDGYTAWCERMADHPNIDVQFSIDWLTDTGPWGRARTAGRLPIVYTGPVDKYHDYAAGRLGWRTVDFEWTTHPMPDYQGCAVMNEADRDVPYTRQIEFRHFRPDEARTQSDSETVVAREFSRFATPDDEPYYPVNTEADRVMLKQYRELNEDEPVIFGGRLGTYQYLDMHMAIGSALQLSTRMVAEGSQAG